MIGMWRPRRAWPYAHAVRVVERGPAILSGLQWRRRQPPSSHNLTSSSARSTYVAPEQRA
eukprot:scaffold3740_cov108-Isochrysis_galbana.AAC.2